MKTVSILILVALLVTGSTARRLKQVTASDEDSGTSQSSSSAEISIGSSQSSQSTTTTTTSTGSGTSEADSGTAVGPRSSISFGGSASTETGVSSISTEEEETTVVVTPSSTPESTEDTGDADDTEAADDDSPAPSAKNDEESSTPEVAEDAENSEVEAKAEPAERESPAGEASDIDEDVEDDVADPEKDVAVTNLEAKGASSSAVASATTQTVTVNGEQAQRICLAGASDKLEDYLSKGYEVTIVIKTNLGYRITKMVRSGFNTSQSSILSRALPADVKRICKDALMEEEEEEKEPEKPVAKKEESMPEAGQALKGVCGTEVTVYFPHLLSLCERYNLPTVFDGQG